MSFADSQVYSSETLAAGEETLALQNVKLENMDDRETMEKELKDNLNQTFPRCRVKIICLLLFQEELYIYIFNGNSV